MTVVGYGIFGGVGCNENVLEVQDDDSCTCTDCNKTTKLYILKRWLLWHLSYVNKPTNKQDKTN